MALLGVVVLAQPLTARLVKPPVAAGKVTLVPPLTVALQPVGAPGPEATLLHVIIAPPVVASNVVEKLSQTSSTPTTVMGGNVACLPALATPVVARARTALAIARPTRTWERVMKNS